MHRKLFRSISRHFNSPVLISLDIYAYISLFWNSLNDRVLATKEVGVDFLNLEASLVKESSPLLDGTLAGAQRSHHSKINSSCLPGDPGIGQDHLINQYLGLGTRSRDKLFQDSYALLVGPVVEDLTEVVESGALDRLLLEEIMADRLDSLGDGHARRQVGQCLREILEHKLTLELGEGAEQGGTLVAEATTDVNEDVLAVEARQLALKWEDGEPGDADGALDSHDLLQGAKALWLGGQPHKGWELRWEGLLERRVGGISNVLILVLG